MHGTHSYYTAWYLLGDRSEYSEETVKGKRERYDGTIRSIKLVGLTMTSKTLRCSYIKRLPDPSEGQQGDEMNKIRRL